MDKALLIEIAKATLQLGFAYMEQAGLSQEEKEMLLNSERDRFYRNIQTPLPEV